MKKLILICSLFIAHATFAQTACYFTHSNAGALNVISFTPAAILHGYSYHWNFGDNHSSTLVSPVHTYNAIGNFQVYLSIYDSSQNLLCNWVDSVTVSNPGGGSCSFTSAVDTATNSVVFTAHQSTPHTYIHWDFGDGHTGNGTPVTWTYSGDHLYTVCMTEIDSTAGTFCSTCSNINTGSSSQTNCSFSSYPDSASGLPIPPINFNANVASGSAVTWNFGDNTTGQGQVTHHAYNSIGNFIVCMTSTLNGDTCTYCDTVTTGNQSGFCSFSFAPDSGNLNSVTFSAVPSTLLSGIHWDFGDNTTGQGSVASHVYAAPGIYTVCMQEYFNGAVICTTCLPLVVAGNAPACHAFFTSASTGLTSYFVDLSHGSPTGFSYQWDFGDGSSSSLRFPHHTYQHPGAYMVCLSIADQLNPACGDQFCMMVRADTVINVLPVCNAFFVILQLAPFHFAVVNLTSGVNLNFHWDFGDGSPVSNTAFPSHHYSSTGTYLLCLNVTDQNGCSSIFCDTLSVDSLGNIHYRNMSGFDVDVLSPSSLTGVEEISGSLVVGVYPNPVSSELTIALSYEIKAAATFKVFALDGSEVTSGIINKRLSSLNVSDWNAGVYILEVQAASGFRNYQKIIKE